MKELRVLHGLSEIAGQGSYTVLGLRELHEKAYMVVWSPNPFGYPYDKSLNINKDKFHLSLLDVVRILDFYLYSLLHYDIFHFHFGRSILLNKDLGFLKLLHKKVFYEFHGSDLRLYKIASARNKYFVFKGDIIEQRKLKKRTEKICKKADGIIIHDYELKAYLPKKQTNIYYVPLRININDFQPSYPDVKEREKVIIVHAPSNTQIKGTKYVIKAIEKLKKEYSIDFILVQNKTQEEAREIYRKADIIVDQLIIGSYGVFAIEGMALGKPVITYLMPDMIDNFPKELPIQNANIENIEDVLRKLIISPELRRKIGIAGRKYVEDYHDYRKVALYLKQIYNGQQKPVSSRKAYSNIKKLSNDKEV